jgi:opacity protein-like surface antigen
MRKYLLAGAAAFIMATPAASTTDNAAYIGVEGGILYPNSQDDSGEVIFDGPDAVDFTRSDLGSYRYKKGLDLDFIGGYDFGMFRVEGELGYKHAKPKGFNPGESIVTAINTGAGTAFTTTSDFNLDNSATVLSGMVNGLLDFGGNGSLGGYAGAGVGYAKVKQFGDSKGKLAWQLLAGVYMPVSENIDIGLKYRYFHAGSNSASRTIAFTPGATTCGPVEDPFACSAGAVTFSNNS